MAPKRTIDRRRRPKGTTTVPPPKPAAKDEDDSSVDVPAPKKIAATLPTKESDSDSSGDEVSPRKKAPARRKKPPAAKQYENEDSDDEELKSDSSGDEDQALQDSSEDETPPPKKKKAVASGRSKAAPKRKQVKKSKPQAKKSNAASSKRGKKKKAPSDDEEEEEEPEEESASDGEESNVSEFDPDAEGEESEDSEESWSGDEKPKRGRAKKPTKGRQSKGRATKRATRGQRAASRRGRSESDSEESWNSDTENERETRYRTPRTRTGRRSSRRTAHHESSEEESSEEDEDDSPRRRSATRALKRIHDVENDENVEEDEDDEPGDLFGSASKRKKKKSDEDEEFDPEAEEQVEEDNDDDFDEESSALSAVDSEKDEQYEAGNVDAQQDFLTADSSDDGGATGPSPMLDIKSKPRSLRRLIQQEQESFDSEDSSDEDETAQQAAALSCSPHMPDCPSEVDAITMDPLPDKHLCFFPPDHQTRQCFALETLHKIALTSSIRGSDGRPTFLQPPHFRTPASDDFIDQIASRFGRSALELTGDFYNRGALARDGYMLTIGANLADEETFQERLNDYISNLMGSQDIYCCPLCYIESHRRLAKHFSGEEVDFADEEKDDPDEPDEQYQGEPIKLWHDPMTVLGFSDNEKYAIASTFCFSKMADVKRHLREAHNVDTKVLDGNSMFARFKIREGDGLLQRYIDKTRSRTYQGDMRRYWNDGNNQTFVFLIHLMKRREILKEMLAAGEDVSGEAAALFDGAQDFYRTFENRAKRAWDTVSAPYRKATKEELEEFIEEGDVEEDSQPPFAMHRELNGTNPEDEILEVLKQRRMSQGGEGDSDSSDEVQVVDENGDAESDADEADPDNIPGYYSEVEEEEDDWVTSKLARPGRRNKVSPSSSGGSSKAAEAKRLGKALGKKKGDGNLKRDPDDPQEQDSKPPPAKKAKRSRIIFESDSDDE